MPSLLKLWRAKCREATSHHRVLPDFLVIGAQRSGTSTLYRYLERHPCIGRALRKEVSYFDLNYHRGLEWYRSRFPTEREKQRVLAHEKTFLTGEATPNYLFFPQVAGRVARTLPQVKLTVLLRNPVDRAYSGFQREVRKGRQQQSFRDVVEVEMRDPLAEWQQATHDPDYPESNLLYGSFLARGLYFEQIQWWLKFFPRDQLLTLKAEEFFREPLPVLNAVCEFFGLPPWRDQSFRESTAGGVQRWFRRKYDYQYPPLEAPVRQRLLEFFRPHNRRLADLLGRDFDWDN